MGLVAADKADGIPARAGHTTGVRSREVFHYSDIGFILLGSMVERLTGETLDVYAQQEIFEPLGMGDTRYLPAAKACGPHQTIGNAIAVSPAETPNGTCPDGTWSTALLARVAPTARDEDTPWHQPRLRPAAARHRPRSHGPPDGWCGRQRRVFSTASDVGRYAQGLLDRLAGRPSSFPLRQATLG